MQVNLYRLGHENAAGKVGAVQWLLSSSCMKAVLNGYILINKEDFLHWVTPTHSEKNLTKKIKDSNSRMVKSLFSKICGSRVGEAYTKASFSHVFPKYNEEIQKARMIFDTGRYNDHKFDWLAAVHPDYLKRTSIDEKADAVENFLITELGECKKLSKTISVNLICSAKVNAKVKGYHLLGAMMYCIKRSKKYEKSAVLELAGRFRNVSGFYSYSTVGFERDETLFGNDCFSDPNNLPMRVKLGRGISLDTIIDHASGKRVPNVKDETNLFENKQYFIENKKVPAVQKEQLTLVEFAELLYDFDIDNKANLRNNMYYNNIVQGAKNKTEKRNRIIEQIKINTPNNTQVSTAAPSATRVSRSSRKRARDQAMLDAKAKRAKATVVAASEQLEQAMREQEEAFEAARQNAEEVQQLFTASLSASPGRRRRTPRRNSASRNSAASSRSRSRGRVGSRSKD